MTAVTRHPEFYFDEPDTVVFKVQNTLFRPHKLILTRYCQYFRDSLDFARLGDGGYGTTDENPIKLLDVHLGEGKTVSEITSHQFGLGLTMLYPEHSHRFLESLRNTNHECRDILEVSRRWGSDLIKSQLATSLRKSDIISIEERIRLAAEYEIDVWLPEAFAVLALRINIPDEILPLTFEKQVKFLRIRERIRTDISDWVNKSIIYRDECRRNNCEWSTASRVAQGILCGQPLRAGKDLLGPGQLDCNVCSACQVNMEAWKDGIRRIALVRATRGLFPETIESRDFKIIHPRTKAVFPLSP